MNDDIETAWRYHNGTKHPNGSLMNRFHSFDSANRPNPYKIYKDLPSVDLPIQKLEKDFSALKAISSNTPLKEGGQISESFPKGRSFPVIKKKKFCFWFCSSF